MTQTDLGEVWARSLEELSDLQIEPHQRAWLRLTRPLGLVENTALIATPNEFVKEQLETRLRALITHALSREFGRNIQLAVTVDPATATGGIPPPRDAARPGGPAQEAEGARRDVSAEPPAGPQHHPGGPGLGQTERHPGYPPAPGYPARSYPQQHLTGPADTAAGDSLAAPHGPQCWLARYAIRSWPSHCRTNDASRAPRMR